MAICALVAGSAPAGAQRDPCFVGLPAGDARSRQRRRRAGGCRHRCAHGAAAHARRHAARRCRQRAARIPSLRSSAKRCARRVTRARRRRWRGSHHQLAMQPANAATVLGDFDDARFTHDGVVSSLLPPRRQAHRAHRRPRRRAPRLPDHAHLRRRAAAAVPGRVSRRAARRRWRSPGTAGRAQTAASAGSIFIPTSTSISRDPLHWTGVTENWNFMCADCHSTNVRKAYDAATGRYATSFAEMSVSCEACHGPGSTHVAWARKEGDWQRRDGSRGLLIALDERRGVSWTRDATSGKPRRSTPRGSEREIEMCARCHSRRGLIHEDDCARPAPRRRLSRGAARRRSLLPRRADQGRGLRVRIVPAEPHVRRGRDVQRLPRPAPPGAARLGRQPLPAVPRRRSTYSTAKHHFHAPGSAGARCVGCHMPATTYMVVDPRRDHSLRVPRPDLSVKLGVPNACNGCHANRSADLGRAHGREVVRPHARRGYQQFAEALAAGSAAARRARSACWPRSSPIAASPRSPGPARSSAWRISLTPTALAVRRDALGDADPLVRRAAVACARRRRSAGCARRCSRRSSTMPVRVRAHRGGAGAGRRAGRARCPAADGGARERATAEFVAAQELDADRAGGPPRARRARMPSQQAFDRAEAELKRALAIDPAFVPAAVNLADLYRTHGPRRRRRADPARGAHARARQPDALARARPGDGARRSARRKRSSCSAPRRAWHPANPRYGYVYAVALHSQGRRPEALRTLESVLVRHPYDRDSLSALAAYYREAGDVRHALRYAERLEALDR